MRALLDNAEGPLLKVGSGRGESPGKCLLQSLHAPLTVLRQFLKSASKRAPLRSLVPEMGWGCTHLRWTWRHLLAGFGNVAQVCELVRVVQAHLGRQKTVRERMGVHDPGGSLLTWAGGPLTSCCCLISLVSSP